MSDAQARNADRYFWLTRHVKTMLDEGPSPFFVLHVATDKEASPAGCAALDALIDASLLAERGRTHRFEELTRRGTLSDLRAYLDRLCARYAELHPDPTEPPDAGSDAELFVRCESIARYLLSMHERK
ncbi:protein of unknown function [Cupriavidus taiwanensis]|uniref:Uncharacterized protein n=1 Tax=Cupriavidus taiwanensis TaxID=164546 RepID=A0A375IGH9_9BURK|nr:hypothetical protein [Cupriavidus taiwanensis]SPK73687.1 protein of unknown function [Cupriavidus taiwanensis]